MDFEHACFISYRHHEQSQLAERFIVDLFDALRDELSMRVEEGIFLDRDRMKGGTLFNPALASALCKSVCMLMIYTPMYFSRKHLYCAREYVAMETLERQRLASLPKGPNRECGLIIPVVLRGGASLPVDVRGSRHFYNFEGFTLTSRALPRNREYGKTVREIADVIADRRRLFAALGESLTCGCESFSFPSEDDVRPWVDRIVAPGSGFPSRGR